MCPEAIRTYFEKIHSQCKKQFLRISRIKIIVLFDESPEISSSSSPEVRKTRFSDRLHMRNSRLLSGKMKYELSTLISLFIAVSYAVMTEKKECTAQPIQKLQAVDSDPI